MVYSVFCFWQPHLIPLAIIDIEFKKQLDSRIITQPLGRSIRSISRSTYFISHLPMQSLHSVRNSHMHTFLILFLKQSLLLHKCMNALAHVMHICYYTKDSYHLQRFLRGEINVNETGFRYFRRQLEPKSQLEGTHCCNHEVAGSMHVTRHSSLCIS